MKTITIRLSDVETAMLLEVQKKNKVFRDLQVYLAVHICEEYARMNGFRAR